jgi:hephaestin
LDENSSPLLDANLAGRTAAQLGVTEDGFAEANLKHAINGFVYCNTPGLEMMQGERCVCERPCAGALPAALPASCAL